MDRRRGVRVGRVAGGLRGGEVESAVTMTSGDTRREHDWTSVELGGGPIYCERCRASDEEPAAELPCPGRIVEAPDAEKPAASEETTG
jgi:hypothetical protein